MEPNMKLRVFLYKPGEDVRQSLPPYIESLGHEVAVINLPQICLKYYSPKDLCSVTQVCADVIIVGTEVAPAKSLSMLEERVTAGCHGAKHNAFICGDLSDDERQRAEAIGCRFFEKPLQLEMIGEWLAEVQQQVEQHRELAHFTIGGTAV
jgi:hypothetical protein